MILTLTALERIEHLDNHTMEDMSYAVQVSQLVYQMVTFVLPMLTTGTVLNELGIKITESKMSNPNKAVLTYLMIRELNKKSDTYSKILKKIPKKKKISKFRFLLKKKTRNGSNSAYHKCQARFIPENQRGSSLTSLDNTQPGSPNQLSQRQTQLLWAQTLHSPITQLASKKKTRNTQDNITIARLRKISTKRISQKKF